jgi:hypothetical protein
LFDDDDDLIDLCKLLTYSTLLTFTKILHPTLRAAATAARKKEKDPG